MDLVVGRAWLREIKYIEMLEEADLRKQEQKVKLGRCFVPFGCVSVMTRLNASEKRMFSFYRETSIHVQTSH